MALSVEDRLDLQDLSARFARGFDAPDPVGLAALFAPGGTFDLPDGRQVGGGQLEAYITERVTDSPNMRHLTTNVLVEETAEGACGSAYFFAVRVSDEGALLVRNLGRYEDVYVRTPHGWRFRTRRVFPELSPAFADAPFVFGAA